MSTFLDNGKILIRARRRFMVFTSSGAFIDEVEFNNTNAVPPSGGAPATQTTSKEEIQSKIKSANPPPALVGKSKLLDQPEEIFYDFKGNVYEMLPEKSDPVLRESNKMHLLQFSFNN